MKRRNKFLVCQPSFIFQDGFVDNVDDEVSIGQEAWMDISCNSLYPFLQPFFGTCTEPEFGAQTGLTAFKAMNSS